MISEWLSFAEAALNTRRSFNIMYDDDRVTFRKQRRADGELEVVTTVTSDPATRAKMDAMPQGDGTYDLFDRMFDGYEVFVPWASKTRLGAIQTPSRQWRPATQDELMAIALSVMEEHGLKAPADQQDPDIAEFARQMFWAAKVARRIKALITISY